MKNKPYITEEEPLPVAEEPVSAYGRSSVSNDGIVSSFQSSSATVSKPGRMTVEEYFDEVRRVLHKKYEDVQS